MKIMIKYDWDHHLSTISLKEKKFNVTIDIFYIPLNLYSSKSILRSFVDVYVYLGTRNKKKTMLNDTIYQRKQCCSWSLINLTISFINEKYIDTIM